MGYWISKFSTEEDYEIAKSSFLRPHVSYTKDDDVVHFFDKIVIRYYANAKLAETTETGSTDGLHVNAFGSPIHSHEFENGVGTIKFEGSNVNIGDYAFYRCSGITGIELPNSVTSIGSNAFQDCSGLTNVAIPDSVTSIGGSAFRYCYGLTSCTIGDNVRSLGDGAFYYCSGLTSCTIGSGVTSIGTSIFNGCSALTNVNLSNRVTSIGESAFTFCYVLSTINSNTNGEFNLPPSVTMLGKYAFESCRALKKINMPGTTNISEGCFSNCWGLTSVGLVGSECSVELPNSLSGIPSNCFYKCSGLTSVTYGSNIKTIGVKAFFGCTKLPTFEIQNQITRVFSSAFTECTSLTSVTIGTGFSILEQGLFKGCTNLQRINSETNGVFNLPNNIDGFNYMVFYNCKKLTDLIIGNNMDSHPYGYQSFYGTSLTSITTSTMVAPAISTEFFQGIKTGGKLYVPVGSSGYDVWMGTGNYYLGKYGWTKIEQ